MELTTLVPSQGLGAMAVSPGVWVGAAASTFHMSCPDCFVQ